MPKYIIKNQKASLRFKGKKNLHYVNNMKLINVEWRQNIDENKGIEKLCGLKNTLIEKINLF